jgi:hypothetical protein
MILGSRISVTIAQSMREDMSAARCWMMYLASPSNTPTSALISLAYTPN